MIVIIADDLTGASDTGVQYQLNGFSTIVKVLLDNNDWKEDFRKYDVLSINTDTRSISSREAYTKVYALTKDLSELNAAYIYKKIDSIMRGNPASELEAVMDGLQADIALVAPSFPENGRIIEDGILRLPDGNKIDVTTIFNEETSKRAINVTLEYVRKGSQFLKDFILDKYREGNEIFVIDAVNDEDLYTVKNASELIDKKKVLCGSAGFAKQLSSEAKRIVNKELDLKSINETSMIVVGSRSIKTANQVKSISDMYKAPIILVDANMVKVGESERVKEQCVAKIVKALEEGERLIIIAVTSLFEDYSVTLRSSDEENSDALLIARVLGEIVDRVYDIAQPKTIVSTGGDTSLQVCNVLKAVGIELEDQIAAGVPIGKIVGGKADNVSIVTKSGGFGENDVLIQVMEYLEKKNNK